MRRVGNRRVPLVVIQWLLLIASTFMAGCLFIVLLPHYQPTVVTIGVYGNVAMALGISVVLTWKGLPQRLFCATGLGAVVTVIGWDFLEFTLSETRGLGGFGAIPLDVIALPIAILGMTILLGVGAAIGGVARILAARCPCGNWLPKLGPSASKFHI
jgi:hypothetical protein